MVLAHRENGKMNRMDLVCELYDEREKHKAESQEYNKITENILGIRHSVFLESLPKKKRKKS